MTERLVRVTYEDDTGRNWVTLVPEGREDDAMWGITLGPPDTTSLDLPEGVAVELHNQLFHRGLITWDDVRKRPIEVTGALQKALQASASRIMNLYREERDDNTKSQ